MAFRAKLEGDFSLSKTIEAELAFAVTGGMRKAAEGLKEELRGQTQAAFRGNRLPKTWRSEVYPRRGDSVDAAGIVYTRAPDIIRAAEEGTIIRSRGGTWLAIPTEAAGKYGLRRSANVGFGARFGRRNAQGQRTVERVTPGGFERRTGLKLRFVYGGPNKSFLVVDNARPTSRRSPVATAYSPRGRGSKLYGPEGRTIVVFVLVRQVRMKKRLDVAGAASRWQARVPTLINNSWRRS